MLHTFNWVLVATNFIISAPTSTALETRAPESLSKGAFLIRRSWVGALFTRAPQSLSHNCCTTGLKKKEYNQVSGVFSVYFSFKRLPTRRYRLSSQVVRLQSYIPQTWRSSWSRQPIFQSTIEETVIQCTLQVGMRRNSKAGQPAHGTLPSFKKTVPCLKISLSDNLETLKRAHPGSEEIQ